MPEVEMVEGVEITPEEARCPGWTTATGKTKKARQETSKSTPSPVQQGGGRGGRRTAAPRNALKKLAAASRLPRLPRDHIRIIVRPRGGLDVKKISTIRVAQALAMAAALSPNEVGEDIVCPNNVQNIYVVSTPEERNARAYAMVKQIHLREGVFEVAAYMAASDNTCKGVVRGVDIEFNDAQLRAMIVHQRNPTALEVRRIKTTTTVIVLFDGLRVPNFVMCGAGMLPCSLYRRQVDVCYGCGELGHRADVCPTPSVKKCRGCGAASPTEGHQCEAKCGICGGPHPTADRKCEQRFQTPYVVRQRRRRRRRKKTGNAKKGTNAAREVSQALTSALRKRSSSRGRSRSRSLSRSRTRSRSRGRSVQRGRSQSRGRSKSKVRIAGGPTWADRVKQTTQTGRTQHAAAQESERAHDPRIAQLMSENASLKEEIQRMKADFEAFRNASAIQAAAARQTSTEDGATARAVKRRATSSHATVEDVSTAEAAMQRSLDRMQKSFAELVQSNQTLLLRVQLLENELAKRCDLHYGDAARPEAVSSEMLQDDQLSGADEQDGTPAHLRSNMPSHGQTG